jgi:type I restriction enzyme M protein
MERNDLVQDCLRSVMALYCFLQHMISKMKRPAKDASKKETEKQGSRIAIVFNGSPLFSGGAGSGPSDIRKLDYLK